MQLRVCRHSSTARFLITGSCIRRTLSCSTELGRTGVSQTDPLQQARQGRPLRGVGAAEGLFRRGSRGLQIAAVGFFIRKEEMRHA